MPEKDYVDKMTSIKATHIRIEMLLQDVASRISSDVCSNCTDPCCKIDFCREGVDSVFLRFILGKKVISYNKDSGWMTNRGCSLQYGRPLLCYEFFCDRFKNDSLVSNLKHYSGLFKKIYQKASGNQHILAVKNLKQITNHRLDRILDDLKNLEQNVQNTFGQPLKEVPETSIKQSI